MRTAPRITPIMFFLTVMAPALASDTGTTLTVSEMETQTFNFTPMPGREATLVVTQGAVRVAVDGGETRPLVEEAAPLNGEIQVDIADYNFDGLLDIGVLEAIGYGGVNLFTAVYVFEPDEGAFRHWLTDSNLHPDPAAGEIHAAQRSGPRYYTTTYRLHGGEPYPYREAVMIAPGLEKETLRDETGAVTGTRIVDDSGNAPARRHVSAERAYFHEAPDENARMKAYIIQGDEVELLDSAGEWDDWLLVRYRGRRVFEHWVPAETIGD